MSRVLFALIAVTACIDDQTPLDTSVDTSVETSPEVVYEACDTPGVTRCTEDRGATEFCTNGVWLPEACGESKLCVVAGAAQCVDSTGDATCRDTLYCFIGCQGLEDEIQIEACLVSCYRSATQDDQEELTNATECFERRCGEGAGFDCIATSCSQALGDCYFDFSGEQTCAQILGCRSGCNEDPACETTCGDEGSVSAQSAYAVLELCVFWVCIGKEEDRVDDCTRRAALPTGECGSYTNACIGLPGVSN